VVPRAGTAHVLQEDKGSLDTLEKLAVAVGADLIVGVGASLSTNRSIAKLERDGHAVVRRAG
jgi:hypothetical protein